MRPLLAHPIMQPELEKIAVSKEFVRRAADSTLAKLSPKDSLKRARQFADSMQDLQDKAMAGAGSGHNAKKFDKALSFANRTDSAAGEVWKADSARAKQASVMDKIAESFERSGRRPISVDRLLEKEVEEQEETPSIMDKIASRRHLAAGAILGAGAFEAGRRANEDRKLGKAIRMQQKHQG